MASSSRVEIQRLIYPAISTAVIADGGAVSGSKSGEVTHCVASSCHRVVVFSRRLARRRRMIAA